MATGVLTRINNVLFRITKEFMIFAGLAMIGLMFVGVITRYGFGHALAWEYEASSLGLVWIAFLGAAAATRLKGHIQFEALLTVLPAGLAFALTIFRHIVVMVFVGVGVYLGWIVADSTFGQSFETFNLPVGVLYAALPVGFVLMFLFTLEILIEELRSGKSVDE